MDNILFMGILGIFGAMLYFRLQDMEPTKEDKLRKLKADLKYWRYERSKSLDVLSNKDNITTTEYEFAEAHVVECNEEIDKILLEIDKCSKE